MKRTLLLAGLLLFALGGVAMRAQAATEQLKGTKFITVMINNTLTGTTEDGVEFNAYFQNGGFVTYEDSAGERDAGRWRMDDAGDVCVTWRKLNGGKESCFAVMLDNETLSWTGKSESGRGKLRGTIVEGFKKGR